jgi:hypothetical protein
LICAHAFCTRAARNRGENDAQTRSRHKVLVDVVSADHFGPRTQRDAEIRVHRQASGRSNEEVADTASRVADDGVLGDMLQEVSDDTFGKQATREERSIRAPCLKRNESTQLAAGLTVQRCADASIII